MQKPGRQIMIATYESNHGSDFNTQTNSDTSQHIPQVNSSSDMLKRLQYNLWHYSLFHNSPSTTKNFYFMNNCLHGWLVAMSRDTPVTAALSSRARPLDQSRQGRAGRQFDQAFFTFHTLAPGSSGKGMTNESKRAARVSNIAPLEVLIVFVSDIYDQEFQGLKN